MTFGIFDTERRTMSIYGYCRISTAKQSIDRQIRNIKAEYPTAHIVQEAYTGTSILRPEWNKLYRLLKEGDTVVFDSVSRMSRNAEDGFSLYEALYHKGIRLVFLKEHHIDGNDFDTAWLNAMYTDVYVYSGKYSNLDAWDQFTQYIAFYDEVVDYDNERAPAPELYDVYYAYDPDTEEEAGQCVDEVIRIAEESGAEIQFY